MTVTEVEIEAALEALQGICTRREVRIALEAAAIALMRVRTSPQAFSYFWQAYPHKVGKRAAAKAFAKAVLRVSVPDLMEGLYRYVRKNDDRPWCNPATWLNQDRWIDTPMCGKSSQPDEPHDYHNLPGEWPVRQSRA